MLHAFFAPDTKCFTLVDSATPALHVPVPTGHLDVVYENGSWDKAILNDGHYWSQKAGGGDVETIQAGHTTVLTAYGQQDSFWTYTLDSRRSIIFCFCAFGIAAMEAVKIHEQKKVKENLAQKQQQQRFTVHCIVLCKGEKNKERRSMPEQIEPIS